MLNGKKIILFGAGLYGEQGLCYFGVRNVLCFVDNKKHGRFYMGKRVIAFDELLNIHRDYDVVITVGYQYYKSIKEQCLDAGISVTHINEVLTINDFESDPALSIYKNKYEGQRCFLIGNGPSLTESDLDQLYASGEISFGCNYIYHIFPTTRWRPTFYVAADHYFIKDEFDTINSLDVETKLLPNLKYDFTHNGDYNNATPDKHSRSYILKYNRIVEEDHFTMPRFSADPSRCLYMTGTVMYCMIQWAAYMGFKEIYLIGVDCTPLGLNDPNYFITQNHFYDLAYEDKHRKYVNEHNLADTKTYATNWNISYVSAEKYSRKHGFKIYNATRGGMLEVFDRVDFDSLFSRSVR